MLCNTCQDLFPHGTLEEREGPLPYVWIKEVWTFDRLSQHGGCFLCHQLWQAIIWSRKSIPQDLTISRSILWGPPISGGEISIGGKWKQDIDYDYQITKIVCKFLAREIKDLSDTHMSLASGQLLAGECLGLWLRSSS